MQPILNHDRIRPDRKFCIFTPQNIAVHEFNSEFWGLVKNTKCSVGAFCLLLPLLRSEIPSVSRFLAASPLPLFPLWIALGSFIFCRPKPAFWCTVYYAFKVSFAFKYHLAWYIFPFFLHSDRLARFLPPSSCGEVYIIGWWQLQPRNWSGGIPLSKHACLQTRCPSMPGRIFCNFKYFKRRFWTKYNSSIDIFWANTIVKRSVGTLCIRSSGLVTWCPVAFSYPNGCGYLFILRRFTLCCGCRTVLFSRLCLETLMVWSRKSKNTCTKPETQSSISCKKRKNHTMALLAIATRPNNL